jgi:hypothetical protein
MVNRRWMISTDGSSAVAPAICHSSFWARLHGPQIQKTKFG